jgi:Phosphotransferase enzyme family
LSETQPLEVFKRHGLRVRDLEVAQQGLNNAVWLTEEFALRVSRGNNVNHPREASLALHALSLGIRTAKPLFWEREYSIWERLAGDSAKPPQPRPVWEAVLDDLERLHANPPESAPALEDWVQHPFPWDRTPSPSGIWDGDRRLLETEFAAQLEPSERTRILELFQPQRIERLYFLHADAFAANIQVLNGEYIGLIDWGNAQWHCLEREFAWMEDGALELALERYDLNLELLMAMRLELLLKVGVHERATIAEVRSALRQSSKRT